MKASIYILIFLAICYTSFAQIQVDCPSGTIPDDWDPDEINVEYYNQWGGDFDIGSVDYQTRTNGGHKEIVIDWNSLDSESKLSESTIKDLLENEIVLSEVPDYHFEWQGTVYVIFKTDCYIQVKCVLNLDINRSIECCDKDVTPIEWYEWLGHRCYDVYNSVFCGYKCCRRAYSVFVTYDSIKKKYVPGISGFTTETYPGSSCSGSSPFLDCQTNDPIPCDGNCE